MALSDVKYWHLRGSICLATINYVLYCIARKEVVGSTSNLRKHKRVTYLVLQVVNWSVTEFALRKKVSRCNFHRTALIF